MDTSKNIKFNNSIQKPIPSGHLGVFYWYVCDHSLQMQNYVCQLMLLSGLGRLVKEYKVEQVDSESDT